MRCDAARAAAEQLQHFVSFALCVLMQLLVKVTAEVTRGTFATGYRARAPGRRRSLNVAAPTARSAPG